MIDRRQTLQSIAVSALTPGVLLAQVGRKELPPEGCTLGFSTYGMKTLTTEKAISVIEDIGFDAFELTVWKGWDADSEKMGAKRRKELRKQIGDSKLVLSSLMEHVSPVDEKQQKNAIRRLKEASDLAHDLVPENPPLIQTVLGGGNFEKRKNELRDRLGEWVRLANSCRATFAIKPHRGGIVSKPSEAVWLFEQLGKPERLRMVYDYSHYAFRELSIEDTVKRSLPYVSHVAVKDVVNDGKRVAFKLPGEAGTVDFVKIIRQLHAGGYRGDINCEVSGMVWGKSGYDPLAAAKKCYSAMSKVFEKASIKRNKKFA